MRSRSTGQRRIGAALLAVVISCGAPSWAPAQVVPPAPHGAETKPLEPAADPVTTVIVPIVGSIDGMEGVRWRTELDLQNELGRPVDVVLQLPTVADQPFYATSLGAGERLHFADVLTEAFSEGTGLSPLLVTTSGKRSVTIHATAYGVRGGELTAPQPITIDYAATQYPLRSLPGLSFSPEYRTNIGLVNLDEKQAHFILGLQRIRGRNLFLQSVVVPPMTVIHMSIQSLFPAITSDNDFTVVVDTDRPNSYAYASVIENGTNRGRYVAASVGGARQ